MSISIAEAITEATQALNHAGVPEARREAGALLAHLLRRDRTFIISHSQEQLDAKTLENFRRQINRRAFGEPMQYITGLQDFFGLEFEVTPDVLIPRPETELLVETALELTANRDLALKFCDVGTGSGCIAIAILRKRSQAQAFATDISEQALKVAQRNAIRHSLSERMSFLLADSLTGFQEKPVFDLIVSNPPYVASEALAGLQREVREFEPRMALTAGRDGLSIIRRLLIEGYPRLVSGGFMILEIGFDQGAALEELVISTRWKKLDIHKDLQGIPRIVALRKDKG